MKVPPHLLQTSPSSPCSSHTSPALHLRSIEKLLHKSNLRSFAMIVNKSGNGKKYWALPIEAFSLHVSCGDSHCHFHSFIPNTVIQGLTSVDFLHSIWLDDSMCPASLCPIQAASRCGFPKLAGKRR